MTISFIFHAPDGSSVKHFQDMLEVESYFGPSLRDGNVSDDGVQRIEAANKASEDALKAYRIVSTLPSFSLNENAICFPVPESEIDSFEKAARLSMSATLAGNRFVFRGQQSIHLALSSLCGFVQRGGEQPNQCREGVAVYIDHHSQTVLVDDLKREAKHVSDLIGRPLLDSPSAAVLTRTPVNEDSGSSAVYLDGLCVGPKELVVSTLQASFARRSHQDDMGGFDFQSSGISPQDVWPEVDAPKTPVLADGAQQPHHSRPTR